MQRKKKHIAIFASGTGSNAEALIKYFRSSTKGEVCLVVSNRPSAGVLEIAKNEKVPAVLVPNEDLGVPGKLLKILEEHEIDYIVLAGFLRKIPNELIEKYSGKIINIHPALLPKFGGAGMYGRKVHDEVIRSAEAESGITIHHVTENYDEGGIIFQAKVLVEKNDTPEILEKKVRELELRYYPEIVEKIIE
jgi:phosphoribosylglycinamide formyltransferase 1